MLRTPGKGGMSAAAIIAPAMIAGVILIAWACGEEKKNAVPPFPPEEALKTFRLPEGYRIELVAAEPLITDPVEIAFDAGGLLYVAEMEDYPADGAPGGRIRVLEDSDGDGYYEKANTFAEHLPYVNGVMPWRDGVLVTSAPNILYLADTTGDRRADIRRVVLTGFALTNPQLRMSSLRYGLDNKIYGAYSRSGGQRGYPQFTNHGKPLTFPANPKKDSADIYPGTDFRFDPDNFEVEPSGGMSQFGLTFDAAGNRFTVWNNIHLRHVVIDAKYLLKNPFLHVPSLMAHVSDYGDAATVYSRAENRLDLHESEIGHFTSACGHTVYTGGLFDDAYRGAAFVCEPVSNLVHADLLTKAGATFSARRDREGEEFLTSTDSWFRPVNTTVGPDGGLYVVDFYRKLVEHPAWIARADDKGIYTHAGVLQESDFLEGNDRGRIYRIVPETFTRDTARLRSLRTSAVRDLVALLDHPNAWQRTTAQRLLVEKADASAIPALQTFYSTGISPEGKLHVLWTLEGLRALEDDLILDALKDESPVVRKQALLLAEGRLSGARIRESVIALAGDGDAHVQLQVALTLTGAPASLSFPALTQLAEQHIADPWFQRAVLLSASDNALTWYQRARAFEGSTETLEGQVTFLQAIASIAGARRRPGEVSTLLSLIQRDTGPRFQQAGLEGLDAGLRSGSGSLSLTPAGQQALFTLVASPDIAVKRTTLAVAERMQLLRSPALQRLVDDALASALDADAPAEERAVAVRVLGLDPAGRRTEIFEEFLSARQPAEVQSAAAKVLARRHDPAARYLLLNRWQSYTAEVRDIVENSFTGSVEKLVFLVDALEEGVVHPTWLSRTTRARLVHHTDRNIRGRAEKIFADIAEDNRDEVVTAFYASTTLPGDPDKGRELFLTTCSPCHVMENSGNAFGPDLLSVSNQTRINLLTMILHPNNNIAPGYDGYLIETSDGRTFTGIMGNETSSAVTLRTADGAEQVISREDIKSILPMSQSLMPEGLEAGLSEPDLADLIEYLKGGSVISDR